MGFTHAKFGGFHIGPVLKKGCGHTCRKIVMHCFLKEWLTAFYT